MAKSSEHEVRDRAAAWALARSLYDAIDRPRHEPDRRIPGAPTYRECLAGAYESLQIAREMLDRAEERAADAIGVVTSTPIPPVTLEHEDTYRAALRLQLTQDLIRARADVAHWRRCAEHYSRLLDEQPELADAKISFVGALAPHNNGRN